MSSRNLTLKLPTTLASRLTLWYITAFSAFLLSAFLVIYFSISSILDYRIDEDLEEDIEEFELLYRAEGLARVKLEIEREIASDDPEDVFLRLLDVNGEPFFSSDLKHWPDLEVDEEAIEQIASDDDPVLRSISVEDHDYDTRVVYGIIGPDTILQIGESVEEKEEIMQILLAVFILMLLVVIPLASYVGWRMARRAVQGIEEVSQTAREIESGSLNTRVTVKPWGDEVQQLADTFNAMLDRIRDLVKEMQELTDNVAHDLRSPLARIRAISESSLSNDESLEDHKAAAADTIEECDRLMQMINATLDLAEVESGSANYVEEEINVSQLAEDACELFQPVADEKNIKLSFKHGANCKIRGNIQTLQRMLANLLDNALKYTPPEGEVCVELQNNGDEIIFSVSDTGLGIPEADQPKIFDRFFRCDQSRSQDGCGLGLSFARAVARAHGGDISLSSKPGQGSTFKITLCS